MRKVLTVAAVVVACGAMVLPGEAQQVGSSTGQFFGGFTPQNLTMKPVTWNASMGPTNLTQAMAPQAQSTKVFNIGGAFHSITMPLFQSHAPNTPIVKPGVHNPLQPVNQQVKPH
jgi:hypothetical protein